MTTPEFPDWTPSEVVQNLQSLGLGSYGSAFLDNDINGEALVYLKDMHLKELGIKLIGHRLTLINFINNVKAGKIPSTSNHHNQRNHQTPSRYANDDYANQIQNAKQRYQDDDNMNQRRPPQKPPSRQMQSYQQQQNDEDSTSYRSSTRKTPNDDYGQYRIARKAANDEDDYSANRNNQRRNYMDDDSDSYKQNNEVEQKRWQMQMRQHQQEPQQPTRQLSNERFQTKPNNYNDTTSRKTNDQYLRRAQPNHYDDEDDFEEGENPFASRPKLRGNPANSPAVKTSYGSNSNAKRYHNDDDDDDEDTYQKPAQRNQQRDDYYSRQTVSAQRKTSTRQPTPSSINRYAQQNDYQDDRMQSNRKQQYHAPMQQHYDEDEEQDEIEEDEEQDDYQHYQPSYQSRRQPTPTNMRQQAQAQPPLRMNDPSNQEQERRACKYCGRNFAIDRIDKHEKICAKAGQKKKKPFDARSMRIKGSEAEQFIHKMDETKAPSSKTKNGVPKYKIEHEKLISNLRAARQYTESAKGGGTPSAPPPPYPDDDDDREQCPYCGRKFAADAAKRHIPVCERMNGNRAKMQTGTRRTGGRR